MKIVPLNDQIVVRPTEAESRTAGGIVLPDSARERPRQGRVLAVGDGRRKEGSLDRVHPQVVEGDRVLFADQDQISEVYVKNADKFATFAFDTTEPSSERPTEDSLADVTTPSFEELDAPTKSSGGQLVIIE